MVDWLSNEPGWLFKRKSVIKKQHAEVAGLVCCFGRIMVYDFWCFRVGKSWTRGVLFMDIPNEYVYHTYQGYGVTTIYKKMKPTV